jgi:hypothetical protein
MKNTDLFATTIAGRVVQASQISAHDLSRYREFQVGMSLSGVAAQSAAALIDAMSATYGLPMLPAAEIARGVERAGACDRGHERTLR